MKADSKLIGHLACIVAYAIYGINIIICKNLTSSLLISPLALFTLRIQWHREHQTHRFNRCAFTYFAVIEV